MRKLFPICSLILAAAVPAFATATSGNGNPVAVCSAATNDTYTQLDANNLQWKCINYLGLNVWTVNSVLFSYPQPVGGNNGGVGTITQSQIVALLNGAILTQALSGPDPTSAQQYATKTYADTHGSGATGATGTAGSTIHLNAGAPAGISFNVGDYAIDTSSATYNLYGPKAASGTIWPLVGALKGTNGTNGTNGSNGAAGSNGANGATPTFQTGNISTLAAGATATANIRSTGANVYAIDLGIPVGTTGAAGTNGTNGTAGATGTNGVTPTFSIGNVTTISAGGSATANVRSTGSNAYVIDIGIPTGATGAGGGGSCAGGCVTSLSINGAASQTGDVDLTIPGNAYATWSSYDNGSFTSINTNGYGFVLDVPVPIFIQQVDLALGTAAAGCTTYPVVSLYDVTTGTGVEVDPQLEITLSAGATRFLEVTPATPDLIPAGDTLMWGTKTAGAGCSTNPTGLRATVGYTTTNIDSTVGGTGTGGVGGTPVVSAMDTTATLANEKAVCTKPSCNPGGVDAPAAATISLVTLGSSPTSEVHATQTVLTTNATSTQTNALWVNKAPACDTCTIFQNDFWMQTTSSTGTGSTINLESDMAMFAATTGLDFMFGLQCNENTHRWQLDNQSDPWIDMLSGGSTVPCNLTVNTWYHVTYNAHRTVGDTSCTLANRTGGGTTPGPCLYFDKLTVQPQGGSAIVYTTTQTMRAAFLPTGWASGTYSQKQTDIGATSGSAKTVTMQYVSDNMISSK